MVCAPGRTTSGTTPSKIFNYIFYFSKTIASMFTTCERFIAIGWMVDAPGKATPGTPASKFIYISKTIASMFTTCESFIAIGWMVCAPGKATPGTPASIIFKFLLKFIIGYTDQLLI